jgi:hypothetical protein
VICTSNGSALTATDLVALMPDSIKDVEQVLMKMKVVPGTTTVAPDTTIDVTLTDEEGDTLWADTGISNVANSWHTLSADIAIYPPIFSELNLALNDIGDSGDQVTLYFISWIE